MPRYYVTIPVVFSLGVEVKAGEEITDTKEAHRLAMERLAQPDGFTRLRIFDSNDEECRCAVVEEGVETPERIASGMCLHISCAETYFEETESCPGKR